jgi:hypothetical protein
MRKQNIMMAILMIGFAVVAFSEKAQAQQMFQQTQAYVNCYAQNVQAGNTQAASQCFNQAATQAVQSKDVIGLVYLSLAWLQAGNEQQAIWYLHKATESATEWAWDSRAGSEQNRLYGRSALQYIVNVYNSNYRNAKISQAGQQELYSKAVWAYNNLKLLGAQPTNTEVGGYAVAGANSLTGSFPTRGFGDSNQVDVWVPFNINVGSGYGLAKVVGAKITIVVKPIGQLTGTDELILKGASGKSVVVYNQFDRLPGDKWSKVEIDLTPFPDVIAAIQRGGTNGRLEGVIEDDSAVYSVYLQVFLQN